MKNSNTRAALILKHLQAQYGQPKAALQYENAFQLLIAVILSAQTTDTQVNRITPALFQQYPQPSLLAQAQEEEIQSLIRGLGLFRNKAKALIRCAQMLQNCYNNEIPQDRDELMKLPGVGRKTANVVQALAFNKPAFPVDTHVFRLAHRLHLSEGKTPLLVEEDLTGTFPRHTWMDLHLLLIEHGRSICKARSPLCQDCPLQPLCPSAISQKQSPLDGKKKQEN